MSKATPSTVLVTITSLANTIHLGWSGCGYYKSGKCISATAISPQQCKNHKGFQYTVPVAGKYIYKHRGFWNFNLDGAPGFRYTGGNTIVS